MPYGVTPTGFVIKPLEVIRQEIDDAERSAIDPGLDLGDREVLGQINAIHAAALAEVWELAQAVYNSAYPDSASGDSLDNVSSITGTKRDPNTKTLVEGVNVTLSPNAGLPAGSVAHLAAQPNARFVSLTAVPPSAVGGVFQVDFEAETAGPTIVAVGQLSAIAETVTGWTAVSNPVTGITGQATETDAELRQKRLDELQGQGSTTVDAIRADLLLVPSVVDAIVFENTSEIVDSAGRPPKSVHAVLRGGAAPAIAAALFATKAGGIATYGAQTEPVLDSMGFSHDVHFDLATALNFYAITQVEIDPLVFDSVGGVAAIKQKMSDYVNNLRIGSDVIYDLVKCAEFDVPGVVRILTLLVGFAPAPTGTADLPVDTDEYAQSDVANIAVTLV